MTQYDFLIVGTGLFGAVCAYELNKKGYKCIAIDKRDHIGGNIYSENIEGISVHKYGAHIFHTDNKAIWDYVNQFVELNNFINSPLAKYKGKLFNLPFNMNTFYQLWGTETPNAAKEKIESQVLNAKINKITNLEEQAISLVGKDIYTKFIKGYTEKQWGRDAKELPSFIIKRIPTRFTYNNNYFNDRYQGIPIGGYTEIIKKMFVDTDISLNCDFFDDKSYYENLANQIIYTGMIDEYFDYSLGKLEYRSLEFKSEVLDMEDYQGNAVVNYTEYDIPYTRVIEHKHFEFGTQDKTVVTKEYPKTWVEGSEPYYPVNNDKNNELYNQYLEKTEEIENIYFKGRLGQYKYLDMDDVIESALEFTNNF